METTVSDTNCNRELLQEKRKTVTVVNLPARTKIFVKINVTVTSLLEGYLPRIPAKDGIYMRERLVSNNNNTCDVMVINSTEKDELIEIKLQEIHPFEYYAPFENSAESKQEQTPITETQQRFKKLQKLIQQDHLNDEDIITKLLWQYHETFLLPGDK